MSTATSPIKNIPISSGTVKDLNGEKYSVGLGAHAFRPEKAYGNASNLTEMEPIVPSAYFTWRIWFDRFVALLLLFPGLPIMAMVTILLFLTSDGPILYKQRRVGKNGKIFTLMKFRSMIPDAEKKTGPVWTSVNDPRITKLGKLLRASHLDELPQIF
ncbi:MAG: sugar transferase, partial [Planctomycetia bacterium]|nr:sugar transferase [Planctomycetia bacterium]